MVDKVIPFSAMFDLVFGIILTVAVLANAKEIGSIVTAFANALSSGVRAVKA